MRQLDRPIFILGSHKSGTSLVRSLIDGGNNIFAVPFETHFFRHMGWWVNYPLKESFPYHDTTGNFSQAVKQWIRIVKTNEDRKGGTVHSAARKIKLHTFDTTLDEYLSKIETLVDPVEVTRCYFIAYMNAIHRSIRDRDLFEDTRVVEKSVDHMEFAHAISTLFKDAKFIHVVRNPYANCVSIRNYKNVDGYPWIEPIVRALYYSYAFAKSNQKSLRSYYVVRYEDLVEDPSAMMREIMCKLDLPFSDLCLEPTVFGRTWTGNSTTGRSFSGISKERLEAWKESIYPFEVAILNQVLDSIIDTFGYQKIYPNTSPYSYVKGEGVKKYMLHRLILRNGLGRLRIPFS